MRLRVVLPVLMLVLVAVMVAIAWPWLAVRSSLPPRDFRSEFESHVAEAGAITRAQGDDAWRDYQRVLTLQREAYIAAFGAIARDTDGNESLGGTLALSDWGTDDDGRVRQLLGAMDTVGLGEALDALEHHRAWRRDLPLGMLSNTLLPDLGLSRALYRALRLRASDPTASPQARAAALRRAMALGSLIGHEPIAISWLVGIAISTGAAEEAQRLAASGALTPTQVRELASLFESPRVLPAADVIEGEMLFGLDAIQTTLRDVPLIPLNRSANTERYAGMMKRYQAWCTAPLATRDPTNPVTDAEIESSRYPMIGILMPAVSNIVAAGDAWEVTRRGTFVALHVEAYALEHGGLPGSLADLGLEARLTLDPCTNTPFKYRPLGTPDAQGRRYLLYSLGLDRTDQDGVEDAKRRTDAFKAGAKSDFVVGGPTRETPPAPPR
ncbi:MAG: hypothetical protein HBSAPP03_20490 [Phycisphaerae bacterium]|nr:MAG: hypothetical protein HBSAPP03_20490 [Phycisphaerae bacterium]